jgi:hypothetical protein
MKKNTYIKGFHERLDKACHNSGLSKAEIARRGGFDRKTLHPLPHQMMGSAYIAKFCAVTGTDANWLLGVKR